MKDLQDTLVGVLGAFVYMALFDQSPRLAMAMIGYHIGVVTMRAHRKDSETQDQREI